MRKDRLVFIKYQGFGRLAKYYVFYDDTMIYVRFKIGEEMIDSFFAEIDLMMVLIGELKKRGYTCIGEYDCRRLRG